MIYLSDYSIDNSGKSLVTKKLQAILDKAENDTLVISEGTYLVSSLFVRSNTKIIFEKKARLLASTNEEEYSLIQTRVAGINTLWYPAILNVIDGSNVTIQGEGIIDGNGPYWWKKYWGEDTKGGMREKYDALGLRFACDYDCKRVRGILISNSSNVTIQDITIYHSGFWNVHILYSHDVIVDKIKINVGGISPSTDGIDIDSSYQVEIKNCITDCDDDSICVKSGRDYDGLETNIPSHDIHIHDCIINKGFGITLGSEVSGGIYDVEIDHINYKNTACGFRIKSSISRKGYIKNIKFHDINALNVQYLIHLYTDWNPSYSVCKLPSSYKGEISPLWEKLLKPVDNSIPNTKISDIDIYNINSTYTSNYKEINQIFHIVGFNDIKMEAIRCYNMNVRAKEYGLIRNADVSVSSSKIVVESKINKSLEEFDNR